MANDPFNFPQFPDPTWIRQIQDTILQASKAIEDSALVNAARYSSALSVIHESAFASALKYSELVKTLEATATIAAMADSKRLNEILRHYSNLVPLTLDQKVLGGSVTVAERVAGLSANVEFTAVASELKTLQPVLEKYERRLTEAPDPGSRALTLQSALKIAVEAFLGVPLESKTAQERLRLGIGFLLLLFTIYRFHTDGLNEVRQDGELSQVRASTTGRPSHLVYAGATLHALYGFPQRKGACKRGGGLRRGGRKAAGRLVQWRARFDCRRRRG